jgi:hypothetical protein
VPIGHALRRAAVFVLLAADVSSDVNPHINGDVLGTDIPPPKAALT